jgi:uncharacterized membrane protein YidH (DUF202 family)
MRTWLVNVLWKRTSLTFLLMGVSFLLFGVMTVNIFMLLKANLDLYVNYGAMVIADGALLQLAELIGYGYFSMLFYVIFKACEHVLVRHLTCERRGTRADVRNVTESSRHSL